MNLHEQDDDIVRSSRSQIFLKIGVFRNFTIFPGKHLCWIFFLIKLQINLPDGLTGDSLSKNRNISSQMLPVFLCFIENLGQRLVHKMMLRDVTMIS